MNELSAALPRAAECLALLAAGYQLRQIGVLRSTDGETAFKLASYITLPSVILQSMSQQPPLAPNAILALAAAGIVFGTQAAASWLYCTDKSVRERAAISGSSVGLSLHLYGYPIIGSLLGPASVPVLVLVDLFNSLAVCGASYLLFASAGAAFPESYPHEDGGTYRGQWRGLRKEGLGVYKYPSGAKYEGEWRDNVKDGRGVYYYPKGGMYEGEWSGGAMNGIGVRTMSSGQVKAGRWRDNQLEQPLELWQCAYAAEGAAEVALAARRTEVGGGKAVDVVAQLVLNPVVWAALLALPINLWQVALPPSIELVTATLAPVNTPLMLLAAGALLMPDLPPPRLATDVYRMVVTRLTVPLVVGVCLLGVVAWVDHTSAMPLAVTMLAFLSPIHPLAGRYAGKFRLNQTLASTMASCSQLLAVPLMCLVGLAAASDKALLFGSAVAADAAAVPLMAGPWSLVPRATLGAGLAVAVGLAGVLAYLYDPKRWPDQSQTVRMVYRGDGDAAGSTAGGTRDGVAAAVAVGPRGSGTGAGPAAGSRDAKGSRAGATGLSGADSSTSPLSPGASSREGSTTTGGLAGDAGGGTGGPAGPPDVWRDVRDSGTGLSGSSVDPSGPGRSGKPPPPQGGGSGSSGGSTGPSSGSGPTGPASGTPPRRGPSTTAVPTDRRGHCASGLVMRGVLRTPFVRAPFVQQHRWRTHSPRAGVFGRGQASCGGGGHSGRCRLPLAVCPAAGHGVPKRLSAVR